MEVGKTNATIKEQEAELEITCRHLENILDEQDSLIVALDKKLKKISPEISRFSKETADPEEQKNPSSNPEECYLEKLQHALSLARENKFKLENLLESSDHIF